jgi:predicted dinucleotide-binding enzyme
MTSTTYGPTAISFNINFTALYGRLSEAHARPLNLWCGDDNARNIVERLSLDAGYEAAYAGALDNAAAEEKFIQLVF